MPQYPLTRIYRPKEVPAKSALLNVSLLTTSDTKRLHPRWKAVICWRAALLAPSVASEAKPASCRRRSGGKGFLQSRTGHLLFSTRCRKHCRQTTWSQGSFCSRESFFLQPGASQLAFLHGHQIKIQCTEHIAVYIQFVYEMYCTSI